MTIEGEEKRLRHALRPLLRNGDTVLRSGLKISHMRLMVALDDHGQISAAASVLNITQPAASRALAEIEAILSVTLYERLPRGIVLTPSGKAFARRARAIILELEEIDREIFDLKSGRGGSVSIGAVTAPAVQLAVPAIKTIRQKFPHIEINIQLETSNVLAKELLASRHDFILARIPDDLNPRLFESRVIGFEKACLIVRRGHPLLRRLSLRLDELKAYDWVLQQGGSLLRRTIEGLFLARNIPLPDRILNTSSQFLTLVMVAQTDAVAPVSVDVAKFIMDPEGLAGAVEILPLDFDIPVHPFSLIKTRNRILSPTAQLLYNLIYELGA